MNDLEKRAAAMYAARAPIAPTWDQLGGVTKRVWMDEAAKPPVKPAIKKPVSRFARYIK